MTLASEDEKRRQAHKDILAAPSTMAMISNDDGPSQILPPSLPAGQRRVQEQINEAHDIFAKNARKMFMENNDPNLAQIIEAIEIQVFRKRETFIGTSKIKKELFIAGAVFSQKIFNVKAPLTEEQIRKQIIDEIRDLLLKMIISASPSLCTSCASIFNGSTPAHVHCMSCDAGLCPNCLTKSALDNAKLILKNIAPISDGCLWGLDHLTNSEEPQDEIPLSPPQVQWTQELTDSAESLDNLIDEEAEDDIPLMLYPVSQSSQDPPTHDVIVEDVETTSETVTAQPLLTATTVENVLVPTTNSGSMNVSDNGANMTNVSVHQVNTSPMKNNVPNVAPLVTNNSIIETNPGTKNTPIIVTPTVTQSTVINTENATNSMEDYTDDLYEVQHVPFQQVKLRKSKNNDIIKENKDEELTSKICSFYIQFRCKHGRFGKGCLYEHPKICLNYMKEGDKGCNKDLQCQYLHPTMCTKTLKGQKCNSKKCMAGHFQGTRDIQVNKPIKKDTEVNNMTKKQDFQKTASKGPKIKKNPPPQNQPLINPELPQGPQAHTQVLQSPPPPPQATYVAPLQAAPRPSDMELLLGSIRDLQNQMSNILKERETGRAELKKTCGT